MFVFLFVLGESMQQNLWHRNTYWPCFSRVRVLWNVHGMSGFETQSALLFWRVSCERSGVRDAVSASSSIRIWTLFAVDARLTRLRVSSAVKSTLQWTFLAIEIDLALFESRIALVESPDLMTEPRNGCHCYSGKYILMGKWVILICAVCNADAHMYFRYLEIDLACNHFVANFSSRSHLRNQKLHSLLLPVMLI